MKPTTPIAPSPFLETEKKFFSAEENASSSAQDFPEEGGMLSDMSFSSSPKPKGHIDALKSTGTKNVREEVGTNSFLHSSVSSSLAAKDKKRSLEENERRFLSKERDGDLGRSSRRFSPNAIKKFGGIMVLILLCAGGVLWGSFWYVERVKTYPALSLVPGSSELLLMVNINPRSSEYALLERHASAFPGYEMLKKKLDPAGEGKTISKTFQDSLKRFNLDLESDILPILGETAYISVNNVEPLGNSIRKTAIASVFERNILPGGVRDRSKDISLADQPVVLGEKQCAERRRMFPLNSRLIFSSSRRFATEPRHFKFSKPFAQMGISNPKSDHSSDSRTSRFLSRPMENQKVHLRMFRDLFGFAHSIMPW
ncbi:MAG: hypothetical protein IPL87_01845 [Candidatus Moraniibacteriota bacterium]|nr:MAG: hypothetical protein IPL87_01845 [Candidatus Moranbacteria bacterium]